MKKIMVVIVAALLMVGGNSRARAQDAGVYGLILGAGGGALVGQAIGRNTEGTLIGTAVGGMMGYIIGNERDKQGHTLVRTTYQRPLAVERSPQYRHESQDYDDNYRERKQYYTASPTCRQTETLATVNGQPERLFGTACLVNGRWVAESDLHISQTVIINKNKRWHRGRGHHMRGHRHHREYYNDRRYSMAW